MTTAGSDTRPETVRSVDFAVPATGTIGERFPSWQQAVDRARETIERIEYRSQRAREDSPDFHPRRFTQDGNTLVVDTRAFVHMRVVKPTRRRPGGVPQYGSDEVAFTWEVFHDGTVETLAEAATRG
jgi:hypothetical protein